MGNLSELRSELRGLLVDASETSNAGPMAAYMKGRFDFLGVKTPERRRATAQFCRAAKSSDSFVLLDTADWCWTQPEREFQYVGTDLLRAGVENLRAEDIRRIRRLLVDRAWWDTVDALAAHVVGPMVAAHDLSWVMDDWVADDDLWIARTALLHQLGFKDRTDAERLFSYCLARCDERDFFIRKAIGWALRQYARIDPVAVGAFVDANRDRLSPLSIREATKHLE